uniref:CWH43-like N-terminal domain-containing protein n=1 Tax=Wuchereria bancrofti TaxID=6293 RepID=A0AAF5PQ49_WUCBA
MQLFYRLKLNKSSQACFSISSRAATYLFSSFPFTGLCFCVFFALYSNFEKATETHCRIRNVLPSISVATGDFYWGRLIWRILIFTHLIPRLKKTCYKWSVLFLIICGLLYYRHNSRCEPYERILFYSKFGRKSLLEHIKE